MKRCLILLILILFLTACSPTEEPGPEVNATAQPTTAESGEPTATAEPPTAIAGGPAATATNSPPEATTAPNPAAGEAVTAVLSLESFCRTGPGTDYESVGAIAAGELVYVVGVPAESGLPWVVVLDTEAGLTCWIWTEHAEIDGDLSLVPEVPVPPLP